MSVNRLQEISAAAIGTTVIGLATQTGLMQATWTSRSVLGWAALTLLIITVTLLAVAAVLWLRSATHPRTRPTAAKAAIGSVIVFVSWLLVAATLPTG